MNREEEILIVEEVLDRMELGRRGKVDWFRQQLAQRGLDYDELSAAGTLAEVARRARVTEDEDARLQAKTAEYNALSSQVLVERARVTGSHDFAEPAVWPVPSPQLHALVQAVFRKYDELVAQGEKTRRSFHRDDLEFKVEFLDAEGIHALASIRSETAAYERAYKERQASAVEACRQERLAKKRETRTEPTFEERRCGCGKPAKVGGMCKRCARAAGELPTGKIGEAL